MEDKNKEAEIDLLELGKKLWDNKKFIIKVTIIGAVIGLVIAFSIPKEYTTKVVFTTNSNDTKAGSMGTLASLAGINLGGLQSSNVFYPEIYPNILHSTSFVQELLLIRVKDLNQEIDTTLYAYIKDGQKSPWWNYIIQGPKLLLTLFDSDLASSQDDKNIQSEYFISEDDLKVMEALMKSFDIEYNKKTGLIGLEVKTQNPLISAFLADTITSSLQQYIIKERTKKAITDLENAEKLYKQSKDEYYRVQQKLAIFIDGNHNLISAKYKINQEKLQNDVDLAYGVYSQMAQQVQVNKIKVQDDTPMFTIIQPALESIYPSKPSRRVVFVLFIFLSLTGALVWTLRDDLKLMIA